jgi:outer membrane protein assembly factor BamD (BamD/ComL family)
MLGATHSNRSLQVAFWMAALGIGLIAGPAEDASWLESAELIDPPRPAVAPVHGLQLADPPLPAPGQLKEEVADAAGADGEGVAVTPSEGGPGGWGSRHLLPLDRLAGRSGERAYRENLHHELNFARQHRREQNFELARRTLMTLLEGRDVPGEVRRAALLELGLLEQDAKDWTQAQRAFAHYISLYSQHPSVPEVLLRQGLLYREMGATGLALAKFYAVMTSALNLQFDQIEDYERIVLQAQCEIGETQYALHQYAEAADSFRRLLKRDPRHLNREQVHYRLIACLGRLERPGDTIVEAQRFIELHPGSPQVPEVRFLLALTYQRQGLGVEAQRQVFALLQDQREQAQRDPAVWAYWKKRAGNEIANQFYHEGEFTIALSLYQQLATIDTSPAWQIPVLYQIGLVHERLLQPQQAQGAYARILDRQKELTGGNLTPSLQSVIEMARWRRQTLGWLETAQARVQDLKQDLGPLP